MKILGLLNGENIKVRRGFIVSGRIKESVIKKKK